MQSLAPLWRSIGAIALQKSVVQAQQLHGIFEIKAQNSKKVAIK